MVPDYTASGTLANELVPSESGKDRDEWVSNHEWDYSWLKGNYHSRRKSRSTLENETSRTGEVRSEETSRGEEGKWVPRRKRKFERLVGLESIENAGGSVQEEKEKKNIDAIKNTTVELKKNDNNLENDTKTKVSDDAKTKKDNPENEGKENATEILEFRSKVPRFPSKLGEESPDGEPKNEGHLTPRMGISLKIPSPEFPEFLKGKGGHRQRKGGRKGGGIEVVIADSSDKDFGQEEEDEEEGECKNEREHKKESDREDSREKELFKIISDVFLPMRNNETGMDQYPWKALMSRRYTKEITKQEGPHLKQTTKETESKMSLFFANDLEQTAERKNNLTNPPNIDNFEIAWTDRLPEKNPNERNKPTEATPSETTKATTKKLFGSTRTVRPMKMGTTEPTILRQRQEYTRPKDKFGNSLISNDESHDPTYRDLGATVLFVTRILDPHDLLILDWY